MKIALGILLFFVLPIFLGSHIFKNESHSLVLGWAMLGTYVSLMLLGGVFMTLKYKFF